MSIFPRKMIQYRDENNNNSVSACTVLNKEVYTHVKVENCIIEQIEKSN